MKTIRSNTKQITLRGNVGAVEIIGRFQLKQQKEEWGKGREQAHGFIRDDQRERDEGNLHGPLEVEQKEFYKRQSSLMETDLTEKQRHRI